MLLVTMYDDPTEILPRRPLYVQICPNNGHNCNASPVLLLKTLNHVAFVISNSTRCLANCDDLRARKVDPFLLLPVCACSFLIFRIITQRQYIQMNDCVASSHEMAYRNACSASPDALKTESVNIFVDTPLNIRHHADDTKYK